MPLFEHIIKERLELTRKYEGDYEKPGPNLVVEKNEKCVGDRPER